MLHNRARRITRYEGTVTGCKIFARCITGLCNFFFPCFYAKESKIHDMAVCFPGVGTPVKQNLSPRNWQLLNQ